MFRSPTNQLKNHWQLEIAYVHLYMLDLLTWPPVTFILSNRIKSSWICTTGHALEWILGQVCTLRAPEMTQHSINHSLQSHLEICGLGDLVLDWDAYPSNSESLSSGCSAFVSYYPSPFSFMQYLSAVQTRPCNTTQYPVIVNKCSCFWLTTRCHCCLLYTEPESYMLNSMWYQSCHLNPGLWHKESVMLTAHISFPHTPTSKQCTPSRLQLSHAPRMKLSTPLFSSSGKWFFLDPSQKTAGIRQKCPQYLLGAKYTTHPPLYLLFFFCGRSI